MPVEERRFLHHRRGGFRGRITSVNNELDALQGEITLGQAMSMLEAIRSAFGKFDEVQAKLEENFEEELDTNYRNEVDNLFYPLEARLLEIIENHKKVRSPGNRPKLPDVQVPKFDGQILNYLSFRNVFSELVVNRDLDAVTKYQYLESSLVGGSAHEIIRSIPSSDFHTAWTRLEEEYNKIATIREKHVKEIYDVPKPVGTSTSLQKFLDLLESNMNALRSLEVNVEAWDLLLVCHLSEKLDIHSRKELEKTKKPDVNLTYNEFKEFVKSRIRIVSAVEDIEPSSPLATSTPKSHKSPERQILTKSQKSSKGRSFVSGQKSSSSSNNTCVICQEFHPVFYCKKFIDTALDQRRQLAKLNNLCFNCLKSDHVREACKSRGCRLCNKNHHTLLHPTSPTLSSTTENSSTSEGKSDNESTKPKVTTLSANCTLSQRVILATAVIAIKDYLGNKVLCRAFLDSGSTSNFITESLVQALGLSKTVVNIEIGGINNINSINKYQVNATIESRTSTYNENLDFLVTRKITGDLPLQPVDLSSLNLPPVHELADPYFHKPDKIDILLGAQVFYSALTGAKKPLASHLFAYSSVFGQLIVGANSSKSPQRAFTLSSIETLKKQIQLFWESEETCTRNQYSLEEKATEKHYISNVKRNNDGKYSVALPLNENVKHIGESKTITKKLFLLQEARLKKFPEKSLHYRDFIQEMLDLGHIEEAIESGKYGNFITHHLISRPSSTTTKHRVVFNASFKTNSGISLNDCLMIGPTIQDPVFVHLIHWREFEVAIIGDIAKMYRQIWIHKEDRKYQKIWWRPTENSEVKAYELKTVTYGTASAPFQAVRTLKQLAEDEAENYPDVANLLQYNFYVDDFVTSFVDVNTAVHKKTRLEELALKGGFELRKFASNSTKVVPRKSDTISTLILGLNWHLEHDSIVMNIGDIKYHNVITKCTILSEISQIFDPLGLCTPVVLTAKLKMQRLWSELNVSWDDPLPDSICESWMAYRDSLQQMQPIEISRTLTHNITSQTTLHGFADASESGYGACIYAVNNGKSILVCGKSRVAPLRRQTIPRLELCAALLLARLMSVVSTCMYSKCQIYCWSDSEITIYRIKSPSWKYNTYVGTRVSEIQELTDSLNWKFVPTHENPADFASRGLMPSDLANCDLWWKGPKFLTGSKQLWPNQEKFIIQEEDLEYKKQIVAVSKTESSYIDRFSRYDKLLRVTAYIFRFILNAKKSKKYRIIGPIKTEEIENATLRIMRLIQSKSFEEEYNQLEKNQTVHSSSRLIKLNPFFDEDKIIRVGGRLENANLSYDHQHQIILPAQHHLSEIYVRYQHQHNLHCGPQSLLNTVRQGFWIIGGRSLCRKIVHKCVTCFKNKPILLKQIMGQIPKHRLEPSRPFQIVGIDYAGPFSIKYEIRTKVNTKAYLCLITCFVTRATHIEVVHDLTSNAFISALRRFVARRGLPSDIYSDNATNFVAANKELAELRQQYLRQEHIENVLEFCCKEGINWHFSPPRSPHFGAMFESIIKQAKYHIKRAVSDTVFTTEQLETIVCQVEACLNSRPITPISNNAEDLQALTPGHFIIGTPLNAIPEPTILDKNFNRLSLYNKMQFIMQTFWKRWSHDYINELQQRAKWNKEYNNATIGQLVLIHDDNLPPTQWQLGRIVEVYPGKDDKIRVVTIKTKTGLFKRSIVKIAPLPINDESEFK